MDVAVGLLALVVVVCAVSALGRRLKVSVPLLLVLAGVAGSYLPFIPPVVLIPDIVLIAILPPLLYAAALRTSVVEFQANKRSIGLLSVGYVIFGTVAIGLVVWWLLPDVPLPAAFALGAVVAPPDAVAATSIARRVGMPRRIVNILEGESLVNDATALVLLRASIAAIAGSVTLLQVGLEFLLAVVGGAAAGAAAAWLLLQIRRRVRNVAINTSMSLVAPFVAFIPAEAIHASGVLAVVVAGLIIGTRSPAMPGGASRLSQRSNWATVQFLLENSVFLLIGLQVRSIIDAANADPLGIGQALVDLRGGASGSTGPAPGLGISHYLPPAPGPADQAIGPGAGLAGARRCLVGRDARRGDRGSGPGPAAGHTPPPGPRPRRPDRSGRNLGAAGIHPALAGAQAGTAWSGPRAGRADPGLDAPADRGSRTGKAAHGRCA